jgi:cyclohexanecarboxyl-CoA dehydrogenase
MLDFSFTPAQEEYRKALREFALRELLPRYAEGDQGRYPSAQIRSIIRFANEFWEGREERDLVTVGITAEEIARGDFNCVLPSLGPPYQTEFFADLSEAQRERWLPTLLSGEAMIGLCITEPAAGSDMSRLEMTAERVEGGWRIDGVKNSVSFMNAEVFYVFARSEPGSSGWRGISGYLVPRDTPGLSFEEYDDLGCRAVPRGIVRFENVVVPDDAMVGETGSAFLRISRFFDVNRAVIALKCVGVAQQSIDETIPWIRERVAFGAPLASHQSVPFALAEAETRLELARWQVRAQGGGRGHPQVPAAARPLRLLDPPAAAAAPARRDRLADRRRHRGSDEADRVPRSARTGPIVPIRIDFESVRPGLEVAPEGTGSSI